MKVTHLSLGRGGQLDLTELDGLVQGHFLIHLKERERRGGGGGKGRVNLEVNIKVFASFALPIATSAVTLR